MWAHSLAAIHVHTVIYLAPHCVIIGHEEVFIKVARLVISALDMFSVSLAQCTSWDVLHKSAAMLACLYTLTRHLTSVDRLECRADGCDYAC